SALYLLSLQLNLDNRHLHSFPTRRSSDLIGPSDRWRGDTPENHDDQRYPAPNRIGHSKAKATSRRGPASARRLNNTFRKSLNRRDRKSTRLNSSHVKISYAVFCLKKNNYN